MIEGQETIAIPIAYIEAFIMMLGAFLIGYLGARIYYNAKLKKEREANQSNLASLKVKIRDLQEEIDHKENTVYVKDRMDQEYEQVQFQKRAFSNHVLTENVKQVSNIDFKRIGYATADEKDDLQDITGIGPYTETKLNDLGIYTFEQVSKFTDDDIAIITELIKFFPDRIKNDRWVAKAQDLKFRNSQNDKSLDDDSKKKIMNEKTTG